MLEQRNSRALLDDRRGAIVVMGLVMAMWLCGMLWMLIGIGDAAIQRERLQDGADAASFASAVYHARGMNVIAMINLVMAALLSVLAALKVSELLNQIYLGIVTANCACVPFGCPFDCPWILPSAMLADDLSARIQAMEPFVDSTLTALSAKQKMIAMLVPYQGQARAEEQLQQDYTSWITEGTAVSISMVPGGKRLGLPVQEDKHSKLCEKAREVILEVVLNPLIAYVLPPAPSGAFFIVAGMAPGAVYYVTSTLCEDSDSNGKTPKKVFEEAKNGNKYFQVYAFTFNWREHYKRADHGTELLTGVESGEAQGAKGAAQAQSKPFELQRYGMAEAEFYYDESGDWESMKDDAMWNMRWRARLRRYRDPPPEVHGLAPHGAATKIQPYVNDVIH